MREALRGLKQKAERKAIDFWKAAHLKRGILACKAEAIRCRRLHGLRLQVRVYP